MRKLADSRVLLSALAACVLMLGQAVSYPLVLCVSGPGHVEVEAFNSGCCAKPSGPGSSISAHDECDGCTDISLETVSDSHGSPAPLMPSGGLIAPSLFELEHESPSTRHAGAALPSSPVPLRC